MTLTMQLTKAYHDQLKPEFLRWYLGEFKSDRLIHVHWSAGCRDTNFADYHIVTLQDSAGNVSHAFNTDVMTDLHAHTDGRNTNSIGTAIACMYGGGVDSLGGYPPSPEQIRSHVVLLADICCNHRIPFGNVATHQERADMIDYKEAGGDPYDPNNLGAPPYGPIYGQGQWACYRWDFFVDISTTTQQVYPHQDPVPVGREFFPDWLRGMLALEIQRRTQSYWAHATPQPPMGTDADRTHGEGR